MNTRPTTPRSVTVTAALAIPPYTCSRDNSPENLPTPDADIIEEVIVEGVRPAEMNAPQIERQAYARY